MQKNNTKSIHLFTINNKLNKNIFDCEKLYDINYIDQNIYKYFYTKINQNNYSNNIFLFNSSYINSEISDFIQSMSSHIRIIVFVDNDNYSIIDNKDIDYIINHSSSFKLQSNIYKLSDTIVNKSLYCNVQIIENKQDSIIYFSYTGDENNIAKLNNYLYPKSNLSIKIFDNNKIKHPQSLGYTSEQTKQQLLLGSKYYICDSNNYYLEESNLSGCISLNLDRIKDLHSEMIDKKYEKFNNPKTYYIDFIRKIIDARN